MSATGGGSDIESTLRQMIEQYLQGMLISSAGGDSPKTNTVTSLPEVTGFGDVIDNAVRVAVLRHMEDNGLLGGGSGSAGTSEQSFGESQGVGLASAGLSRIQNPAQIVQDGLGLLPHAAIVSFALALIPIILNEITKPGGPFDLRFKRVVEKEFNALMDRQTLYDLGIGERSLIIQSRRGFIDQIGRAGNTNTLRQIREGGINREHMNQIDYIDHSQGLF